MRRLWNTTGIQMGTNFQVAPEGVYTLKIDEVIDTKDGLPWKTKNGDDYVQVVCHIDDVGEYLGTRVWMGVVIMEDGSRKGAGIAVHFLKALDEPWEGKIEIDTDRWIGKKFKVKLVVAKDFQGRAKNEVAYVITEEGAATSDDEVPF